MSLRINDEAPNFTAETTQGTINFHQWIGNGWAILFSHPKDFTPVCTTELGYMAGLQPEFAKRNCKIIGLSVDPVTNHGKWAADASGFGKFQAYVVKLGPTAPSTTAVIGQISGTFLDSPLSLSPTGWGTFQGTWKICP